MVSETQILKSKIISVLDFLPVESLRLMAEFAEFLRTKALSWRPFLAQFNTSHQLAQDYDDLATMYTELADDIGDEVWLPLENESLAKVEGIN